ncbi:MAG: OFA family MFS transporter [Candidatus Bathyarchaeia archaeon]
MYKRKLRILGLRAESGRWIFVVSGLIMMLCLGAIYAYSIIRVHLEKIFEGYGIRASSTEMQLPYLTFLLLFALSMPLVGRYIEKYGPRKIALLGAALVSLAWFSASIVGSPLMLVFLYGVIGGLGVGIAYNCPIVVSAKWFPDKRGLAVGLTVLGFGLSAALIGPLADNLATIFGAQVMLRIFSLIFLALMAVSAVSLHFPPGGWSPAGWNPSGQRKAASVNLNRGEMTKTRSFYALWVCYMIGTLAGLMAIGISKQVGLEVAEKAGLGGEETSPILTALIIPFALCNGLGRPLFGWLTDRLAPRKTAIISFALILIASLTIFLFQGSISAYVFSFAILWLNLGGWLAIAPAATATLFGTKDYAQNYGLVFTAYGAGALVGNLMAGRIKDILGSYMMVFPVVTMLSIVGIITATILNPPEKPKREE